MVAVAIAIRLRHNQGQSFSVFDRVDKSPPFASVVTPRRPTGPNLFFIDQNLHFDLAMVGIVWATDHAERLVLTAKRENEFRIRMHAQPTLVNRSTHTNRTTLPSFVINYF